MDCPICQYLTAGSRDTLQGEQYLDLRSPHIVRFNKKNSLKFFLILLPNKISNAWEL